MHRGSFPLALMKRFLSAWLTFLAASPVLGEVAPPGNEVRETANSRDEQMAFFESRIRPVLAERCWKCHGKGGKAKGDLRLDSRASLLQGGKRGPAISPRNPEESLLLQAIRHDPAIKLKMPPDGRLDDHQLADLTKWIVMGAPWPDAVPVGQPGVGDDETGAWYLKPVSDPPLPTVKAADWPTSAIDHFLLAGMERDGLSPSPPADKRTLIRRATFDLLGLAPTAEEIDAFLADASPNAFATVVDRLLQSPHYGERWARHWLDVIGYAESDGHQYDPDKPHAFRYRDYVIEAFQGDLPFDQFVREHFAGDLLTPPRVSEDGTRNQSVLATGFLWLGEVQNIPVDPARARADRGEKQIDVVGKAFLAQTLACARCHDHKFDPITTKDYYALLGILYGSRETQRCVDSSARSEEIRLAVETLVPIRAEADRLEALERLARRRQQLSGMADAMLAAHQYRRAQDIQKFAEEKQLEPRELEAWAQLLTDADQRRDPIFYAWGRLSRLPDAEMGEQARSLGERLQRLRSNSSVREWMFEDFETGALDGWENVGWAFKEGPTTGSLLRPVAGKGKWCLDSGTVTRRLTGRLLGPPFRVTKRYVNLWIAGTKDPEKTCVSVMVSGQRAPSMTATGENSRQWKLVSLDAKDIHEQEARLEILDDDENGFLCVDDIFFSDELPTGILEPNARIADLLSAEPPDSLARLARQYQDAMLDAIDVGMRVLRNADFESGGASLDEGRARLWQWALEAPIPLPTSLLSSDSAGSSWTPDERARFQVLQREQSDLERRFPNSALALTTTEGEPGDLRVQRGGDPANLGDLAPRGAPVSLLCGTTLNMDSGSGRLPLAEWVASPENPLTARVCVNRLWQHHFGRGLVATPDNFGAMGERPSHPELLDFLASRLIESGWSIKAMHRWMMLSSTYQQSSVARDGSRSRDPRNILLSSMPIRRLEAECIRDAMLLVAGNLDPTRYGPSVPMHLTPFLVEGRDLPTRSGPLDGAGRRSIYLEVRRNHREAIFSAFDFPKPDGPTGRREVSVVPGQALVLLNDPFVAHQAKAWAKRVLASPATPTDRLRGMYLAALGRPPSAEELNQMEAFLAEQLRRYAVRGLSDSEQAERAWGDVGQVLFNVVDFIFVR